MLLVVATPALAWDVSAVKDPMTDKSATVASVTGRGASLSVTCTDGEPEIELKLDQRIAEKNVSITYRFDDGSEVRRTATVSRDGYGVRPWPTESSAAVWRLKRAKRLRLVVNGAPFDFDLSTGASLPMLLCS
jgi:hypothetical protein